MLSHAARSGRTPRPPDPPIAHPTRSPVHEVEVEHVVPFHDCDMMRIVWHGHYYKYFELARSAFAGSLGLDWPDLIELGVSMPIVKTQAEYRAALVYGDRITIRARCEALFSPALELAYEIRSQGGIKLHSRGVTRQVYVIPATQEVLFAQPPLLEERLRRALLTTARAPRGPQ